uniref:Uncharacterized protein n=1 Tax=Acrobeloides nanus TaxID=290746 RepID=A0A914CGQ9_9BILA
MGISIALDPTTAYCFDNMAYRYLCAKQPKYNVNFSPDREALYQQSYRISRDQTCRLIDYVLSLQPHNASDSLSIFSARNTIFRLNDPLVKISTAVQRTIQKIQDRQEMVNRCHGDIRQLRKILKNRIKLIRWKIDTNERIVCTNCKVKKCYYGDDRMQFLEVNPKVMDKDPFEITMFNKLKVDEHGNMTCPECGPNFKYRKSVGQEWYTSFEEFKEEENPTVASQISARQKTQDDVNQQLREEEQLRKELKQERDFIVEASVKFAHFLKKYSMTTYNDAAERYLKKLIAKEEKIGVDESKLKSYVDLHDRLIVQKELLEKALKNPLKSGQAEITPADVHELVEKLKKLKHYGKDIEDALNREVVVMTEREFAEHYNGYVDGYLPFQCNVKIKKAWKVFKNYIF